MRSIHTAALLLVAPALVHAQSLLRDVNPGIDRTRSSTLSSHAVEVGGRVFFRSNDGVHGEEPWVTDGTAAGTHLVSDLALAGSSSTPSFFVAFLGGVAFTTTVPTGLWWSDGTSSGTTMLCAASPQERLVVFGNHLFFPRFTSTAGEELWISDGTPAGTALFADLVPGSASLSPRMLQVGAGALWFLSSAGELWRSDGTPAGTVPVVPAPAQGSLQEFAVGPSGVTYCVVGAGVNQVWFTPGAPGGAVQLIGGFVDFPSAPVALGAKFLFLANDGVHGRELYVTDGTPLGTALLFDIDPDPQALFGPSRPVVVGNLAFFAAHEPVHGTELWATDGTAAGTRLVKDLWGGVWDSSPGGIRAVGSRVVFSAEVGLYGTELWVSDGTAVGTQLVRDVFPGTPSSNAFVLAPLGNGFAFGANDGVHGFEPWISDGTPAGSQLLLDIAQRPLDGVLPTNVGFAPFGLGFVFAATDGVHGLEPWISDGTETGTRLLADLAGGAADSTPDGFVEWKGRLWFAATDGVDGRELFVSDGTAAGTSRFASLVPGPTGSNPAQFTPIGDRLVFVAGPFNAQELWSTDGTLAGTAVLDVDPSSSQRISGFERLGDFLYFAGNDSAHGTSLWRTDGTLAGTSLVADILPGPGSGRIAGLRASGGLLWFSGTDIDFYLPQDLEPWVSDGTAQGTHRLVDLAPGLNSSSPSGFVEFAGRTWFTASLSVFGPELYVSDGTAAGTVPFFPGTTPGVGVPVVAGDRLFFARGELWATDGTQAGTAQVADIYPGAQNSSPASLLAIGDGTLIAFTAQDFVQNREVWISDGTAAGTRVVEEVWPAEGSSSPAALASVGSRLLFVANSPQSGLEPWITPFAAIGATLARRFGQGCGGASGVPSIDRVDRPNVGSTGFAITLEGARPSAPAAFFFGTNLAAGADLTSCGFKLLPPAIAVGWNTDGAGRATQPLAVPNDPGLLGFECYTHWLVLDTSGGFFGAATLSDLLQIVVGNR